MTLFLTIAIRRIKACKHEALRPGLLFSNATTSSNRAARRTVRKDCPSWRCCHLARWCTRCMGPINRRHDREADLCSRGLRKRDSQDDRYRHERRSKGLHTCLVAGFKDAGFLLHCWRERPGPTLDRQCGWRQSEKANATERIRSPSLLVPRWQADRVSLHRERGRRRSALRGTGDDWSYRHSYP